MSKSCEGSTALLGLSMPRLTLYIWVLLASTLLLNCSLNFSTSVKNLIVRASRVTFYFLGFCLLYPVRSPMDLCDLFRGFTFMGEAPDVFYMTFLLPSKFNKKWCDAAFWPYSFTMMPPFVTLIISFVLSLPTSGSWMTLELYDCLNSVSFPILKTSSKISSLSVFLVSYICFYLPFNLVP